MAVAVCLDDFAFRRLHQSEADTLRVASAKCPRNLADAGIMAIIVELTN